MAVEGGAPAGLAVQLFEALDDSSCGPVWSRFGWDGRSEKGGSWHVECGGEVPEG